MTQLTRENQFPIGTPENPSDKILTLANLITAIRFILTLAFLVIFVSQQHRELAIACYIIAALTDFLDGQVARRTHTVSWIGKIMDPIMDRLLLFIGVLGLVLTRELPLWIAVFVCGRDALLAVGMILLQRYQRRPVDVTYVGKVATALLMLGFSDMLLGVPVVPGIQLLDVSWLPGLNAVAAPAGIFSIYLGILCSTLALIRYVRIGIDIRRSVVRGREAYVGE